MPSVWITANAGSGKTTYLTERVLGLLMQGVPPERICCITYTKAAASEMRHRVLSKLRALLLMSPEECAARVEAVLGRPATQQDVALARGLFGRVLDSPTGGLQLTTIHGFCQAILTRFPLEAGINPHFTVLEEGAAETLIATTKHRLLNHYEQDNAELNAALEMIALRASEARFDQYIGAIIAARGKWETLWRSQSPQHMRVRMYALHDLPPECTEQALVEEFATCVREEEAAILRAELAHWQNHEKESYQKMGRICAAWLELDATHRATLVDEFCLVFLTGENTIRKTLLTKKDYPDHAPIRRVMEEIAARAFLFQQRRAALACAEESFAVSILARELLGMYRHAKEAVHALDYDDLIGKTRELFANPAMLGWVMSKLDHRIDHLLLDEAQDTSGEQWAITQLLVDELIAANDGVGSANLPRSVLVVGDEKQSIYSFQGAAPELFSAFKHDFTALLQHSAAPMQQAVLSNSYRSTEAVLTLVDTVAVMPEIRNALSAEGVVPAHQLIRTNAAGSVTLYPLMTSAEKEAAEPLTMPMEYFQHQHPAQQLAGEVASTIHGWLHSGRMLESEGRPVRAGDILILVRSRTTIVLPLIRALERLDVPVAGLDRLTLSQHLAVRDILALMAWVMNPADDLALAQVLRSPIIGMGEEALRDACVGRTASLWAALGTQPLLARMMEHKHNTAYDFLTTLLEVEKTRIAFAARFGEEVHEVLDELKAQAAAMPRGMPTTLANFYDWLSGSTRQIKREQDTSQSDRVRIMTVHGAKGLEAPIVLLVDTVAIPTTQKEVVYFTPSAQQQMLPVLSISEEAKRAPQLVAAKQHKADALRAEYYRLLYVALTRARDELHVWGMPSKKGEVKPECWYGVVAEAMRTLGATDVAGALQLRCGQQAAVVARTAPETSPALPAWATMPTPARTATMRAAKPSELTTDAEPSAYVASGGAGMRARGVRIHRILELLTADSTPEMIGRLARMVAPEWSDTVREEVVRGLVTLHAQERWIWQSPAYAEVNISGTLNAHGEAFAVNGQMDRLIETEEALVILDYKTGAHVPSTAEEISENYRLQLKTYHALMTQIRPDKPVRCAILWTAAPSLMWCDEAVAATQWKMSAAA